MENKLSNEEKSTNDQPPKKPGKGLGYMHWFPALLISGLVSSFIANLIPVNASTVSDLINLTAVINIIFSLLGQLLWLLLTRKRYAPASAGWLIYTYLRCFWGPSSFYVNALYLQSSYHGYSEDSSPFWIIIIWIIIAIVLSHCMIKPVKEDH